MSTYTRWQRFWVDKTNPLLLGYDHDKAFAEAYAGELRWLLPEKAPARVLELGCGCGTFYRMLGFDRAEYRGVDASQSMLDEFSRQFPGLDLVCGDGSSYEDGSGYDLIFANGVVQYFDPPMLARAMANARRMLRPEGVVVLAAVPLLQLRPAYRLNCLTPPYRPNWLKLLVRAARSAIQGDPLGHWYSYEQMSAEADRHGMKVEFFNSLSYLYRFHARFRLQGTAGV